MTLLKHQIHHCIFRPDDNNILPDKLDDLFQEIFKNKQKDSILAIGAHPDDIEIGCGGTLVKLIEKGHPVHILVLSSGERGNNSNRYEEALQSANHLGASITVETLKDTAIPSGTPTIQLIEKAIDKHQPQIVYSHSIHDNHQDHRSTHKATIIAARQIPFLLNYHSPSCTTDFTAKHFEVLDDKTIAKLSGVVIRMCGGFFSIFVFSYGVVSPVLTATLIPSFLPANSSISFNGVIKLTEISFESAFSGEMYIAYVLSSKIPFSAESINSFKIARNPVNVLVAPVGAEIKTFFLLWISITPYN